jgi:hypothetical protein
MLYVVTSIMTPVMILDRTNHHYLRVGRHTIMIQKPSPDSRSTRPSTRIPNTYVVEQTDGGGVGADSSLYVDLLECVQSVLPCPDCVITCQKWSILERTQFNNSVLDVTLSCILQDLC